MKKAILFAVVASLGLFLSLSALNCGKTYSKPSAYYISGKVLGATNVTVSLSGNKSDTTITDSSGNYIFTGLNNGDYTVTPSKSGYTFAPQKIDITISGGNSSGNNFTASKTGTYSISGYVLGTLGYDNVGIGLCNTGHYFFSGLSNEDYSILASKSGYKIYPLWLVTTISGKSSTGNNFVITPTGTYLITGKVTGADNVSMSLSGPKGGTTITGVDGSYAFSNLINGSYTVTPSKPGYSFSPSSKTVTIYLYNEFDIDFTATPIQTYSLSGTVTGADNVSMSLSGPIVGTTSTGTGGAYSFSNLIDGSYTVTPSKSGYYFTPASKTVAISNNNLTGIDFTATPVFTLSGTVTGAATVTMTLSGDKTGVTTTGASGSYSFSNIENGSYTVTPSKPNYYFYPSSRNVTISGSNSSGNDFTASFLKFLLSWGASGGGNGQFNKPTGIDVISGSGDVYVVDTFNHRIQKFNSSGNYVAKWGSSGSGNGQFNNPHDIAISQISGTVDNIFVSDTLNNRLQIFDKNMTYIDSINCGANRGVACNPYYGYIFVATSYSSPSDLYIDIYEYNGELQKSFGAHGTGNGEFKGMCRLAATASNDIYVTDPLNYRVQKFTYNGETNVVTYVTQWGSNGTADGQFKNPEYIAVDKDTGNVYVSDPQLHRVQVFDSNGTFLYKFGVPGSGDAQFNKPHGIAIDYVTDHVYVADENPKISKFKKK
jgi:hypothetical protein